MPMGDHPALSRRALLRAAGIVPLSLTAQSSGWPNILWIVAEDISPDLGRYGDSYAVTPTADKLGREGLFFTHASGGIRRLRSLPVGACHGDVSHKYRHDAHADSGRAARPRQVLDGIAEGGGILLLRQRQDRLSVRGTVDGLGPERTRCPLAGPPPRGPAVLRRLQSPRIP